MGQLYRRQVVGAGRQEGRQEGKAGRQVDVGRHAGGGPVVAGRWWWWQGRVVGQVGSPSKAGQGRQVCVAVSSPVWGVQT